MLPANNSPDWLGLPGTAENQLQSAMGNRIISRLSIIMQDSLDQQEVQEEESQDVKGQMKNHLDLCTLWLHKLEVFCPEGDVKLVSELESCRKISCSPASSPLQRCLAREVLAGLEVCNVVTEDLKVISAFCNGHIKGNNIVRELMSSFSSGKVPSRWSSHYITGLVLIGAWINDLQSRCQYANIHYLPIVLNTSGESSGSGYDCDYWLGGMFSPETFITATRQQCAQANGWSLEDLQLFLDIDSQPLVGQDDVKLSSVSVDAIFIESFSWCRDENRISYATSELRERIPKSVLRWQHIDKSNLSPAPALYFPLYLNDSRSFKVSEVFVDGKFCEGSSSFVLAQRGVAFILQLTL